ncbi:Nicotinamide phosphoribosyltransferase [Yersinia phage fHe-Yen9-04]|uniref:Nicotinamide phosphoribosyltransferase n=2 Tax=Eneladusvirus Yen904 TaxID=2560849 RepID=A0A2C9CX48_9CAUD|nr:nicotinamide phosphoribosyl transferase [Yersinia phage fHe-Yen9-04]SOK58375.1 Nicotinamide phosphoribosyltransferase [Yersinia phage fHe-Yen9-04]SOK58910.1 Nicotinamide phosphoribosyltransferase [Yersinia phage fHe-Yen9-03]VUE36144.1 Nicotinamide phosphoribosyltransferase [Yersinia phage fHe-Yen9-04]
MKNLKVNFILNVDSYKTGHGFMMKDGVVALESNIIARKPSKFATHVVMMGIQYYLQEYLDINITVDDINEAEHETSQRGDDFDREFWEHIVEVHGGKIPLHIRAIPEGTLVPVGCPLVRTFSTDERVAVIESYIETQLQRAIWFPTTVASNARSIKEFLADTMERHAGHRFVDYHLHNFGDRGASSYESAMIAGMAHATVFNGSDCLSANRFIKYYYNTDKAYLTSVTASEHSATCSNSDADKRDDFNMALKMVRLWEKKVDRFIANGSVGVPPIVSIVIDTYDAYRFVREFIGTRLKDMIIEIAKRCPGAKLVMRPDSGDPTTMPIEIIELLMEKFGSTVNGYGYKVLPPFIGVIQGDGINETSIRQIVSNLDDKKLCIENIVFGMGGKLVHPADGRDTFSFAMKGSAQKLEDATWEDLFKDPITDVGKRSLRGRVTTYECTNTHKIIAERIELQEINPFLRDMMVDMYIDGVIMNLCSFDEVRERANKGL